MKYSLKSYKAVPWLWGGIMAMALSLAQAEATKAQISVLYDALGKTSTIRKIFKTRSLYFQWIVITRKMNCKQFFCGGTHNETHGS